MIDTENNVYYYKIDRTKHAESCRNWYLRKKEDPEYKKMIARAKASYYEKNKEEILRKKREAYKLKKQKEKEQKEKLENVGKEK